MARIVGNGRSSSLIIFVVFGFTGFIYLAWNNSSNVLVENVHREYAIANGIDGSINQPQRRSLQNSPGAEFAEPPLNIEFQSRLDGAFPGLLQSILSSTLFSEIPLLPLNVTVIERLLETNALIELPTVKPYAFGVQNEHWPELQDKVITGQYRLPEGHCELVNISEWCLVFRCAAAHRMGDVFLYKLYNETNYWTIRTCLGDRPLLALKILSFSPHLTSSNISILLPHDLRTYGTLLRHGQFLQCDYKSAKSYRRKYSKKFDRNVTTVPFVPNASIVHLAELRDLLHSLRMTPFLCGGTLLGWRRECAIIPYTSDYDFCVPISQYNEGLEAILANHGRFILKYRFGKPSDSLEYTVFDRNGVRMDIFFLYEEKDHSWVGGMGPERMKLKYTYPKVTHLCAVDLLGHLFHAPCNIDQFIIADYGPNWTKPIHQDNYIWYYSSHSVTRLGQWPAAEAAEVEKVF